MLFIRLILIVMSSTACSNTNSPTTTKNIQAVMNVVAPKEKGKVRSPSEVFTDIYAESFLMINPDLRICPQGVDHLMRTNARVQSQRDEINIGTQSQKLNYYYNLKFQGDPRKFDKSEDRTQDYHMLVIEDRDEASLNALKKIYPNIEPSEDIDCLSCKNSKQPLYLLHSSKPPWIALYLTKKEDDLLIFSSRTQKITLVPLGRECPE